MNRDDPLCQRSVITPDDLANRPLVAVTGDHSVDRQLEAIMAEAGATLRYNASSYFYAIARNMVAAGDYISVIDPVNGKAAVNDGVVWRPLAPKITHELAMVTSRGHPLGIAATKFKKRISEKLQKFTGTSAN